MNMQKSIKTTILLCFLLFSSLCNAQRLYYAQGENGAVSCGHPLAAETAIEVLKNGGNSVDAAVAASFVLGVTEPSNSGLGGEGFALIYKAQDSVLAIDGSSRRPQKEIKNHYNCHISLPAIPEMLIKMNRIFGKKPLAELINPAIHLCDNGFEVSPYLSETIKRNYKKLRGKEAKDLLAPNGIPLATNHILKQPLLGKTLKELAKDEGLSFYYGEVASNILSDMKSKGASYTKYDFMSYKSRLLKPVSTNYKSFRIFGNPLPSSAPITIKLAKFLLENNLNLNPQNLQDIEKLTNTYRKFIEQKHHYSSSYYENSQELITLNLPEPPQIIPDANDSNTTHLCVWDKDNMVVSMTLTLGNHFGTGQLSAGGFFYGNSLRIFSNDIVKYPNNYPAKAGAVTSKSPIIVTLDNRPWLALGGAGADRIITNTATILAKIIKGQTPYQATQQPRYFKDYKNNIFIESCPENAFLKEKPNNNSIRFKPYLDDFFGLVSVLQKNHKTITAVGDKRRDGSCLTY